MKIIISPSKTMDFTKKSNIIEQNPLFNDKTRLLVNKLKNMDKDELSNILKIDGKLLDKTYDYYTQFGKTSNQASPAILSYTGEVFKQLELLSYDTDDYVYIQNHLYILSALYGALRPFDTIEAYRLDMTKSLIESSLYDYWSGVLTELINDNIIINLASKEYSKLIKKPLINIHFLENKNGSYKNVAIYSKRARGLMLNYLVKNKIESIDEIKGFTINNYRFDDSRSNTNNLYFIRS